MPGSRLHESMIVSTILPDGNNVEFSLAEYLAWREFMGIPVIKKDLPEEILWINAHDNNLGRTNCWLSIQEFRKEHPDNLAVKRFNLLSK